MFAWCLYYNYIASYIVHFKFVSYAFQDSSFKEINVNGKNRACITPSVGVFYISLLLKNIIIYNVL